jgi:hypothetical protein
MNRLIGTWENMSLDDLYELQIFYGERRNLFDLMAQATVKGPVTKSLRLKALWADRKWEELEKVIEKKEGEA